MQSKTNGEYKSNFGLRFSRTKIFYLDSKPTKSKRVVKVEEAPAFKTNPTRESTDKAASDNVNPDKDVKGSNIIVSAQATSPKA